MRALGLVDVCLTVLNQLPYLVGGSLSSTTGFSPDPTLPLRAERSEWCVGLGADVLLPGRAFAWSLLGCARLRPSSVRAQCSSILPLPFAVASSSEVAPAIWAQLFYFPCSVGLDQLLRTGHAHQCPTLAVFRQLWIRQGRRCPDAAPGTDCIDGSSWLCISLEPAWCHICLGCTGGRSPLLCGCGCTARTDPAWSGCRRCRNPRMCSA